MTPQRRRVLPFIVLTLLSVSAAFPRHGIADASATGPASATQEDQPLDELTGEAQQVADDLRARLPDDSEARAMLDHILAGSQLGSGEGWFKAAVSQTRFNWQHVRATYDANDDQRVRRQEFPGDRQDFARLDRDADGALTEDDFKWSRPSMDRTPGLMLFFLADRDANGKLTSQEMQALFESLDTGSHGFLALDDLRDQFLPPGTGEKQRPHDKQRRPDAPSRSTLVLGLARQEIGSLQPGPNVDEPAPDFTLTSLEGHAVRLSEQVGEQPIVLIFGNFTCGPFRSQAGNIEKLYTRYSERAKFFLVYVREAHPSDGWWMQSNQRVGIKIPQPQENQQRSEVAAICRQHLELDIPFLVDSVDDRVGATYSGMPNRLYLIDSRGKIAFKNGRGPFGFHPRELEQALILLLNAGQSATSSE